ncbi:WD40/YVTN/BNR-like repeat-containing protein [Acidobacteriota bacterium]
MFIRTIRNLTNKSFIGFFILAGIFLASACNSGGVQDSEAAIARLDNFTKHQEWRAASPFNQLKWFGAGGNAMSGRMTDVDAHPAHPGLMYAAIAQGGVFKTTDDGETWTSIFEDYPTASIGDIALDQSNPDILWVGTGEANIFRSGMSGAGVWKSTDAGDSFQHVGLTATEQISRILIHPENSNIVYVAAAGNEYQYNPERGVYKTKNGGKTWQQVFYIDEKTGVIDLAIDPEDPNILYAGTAERLRRRWNDPWETPQSGLYKTTDGGKTWAPLSNGLPDFSLGECERIGLDVCATQPNVVYAIIHMSGAHLYRSDDKGENWALVEGNDAIKRIFPAYGWVFGQVRVAPYDPDIVYAIGFSTSRSKDGGKTWESLRHNHVDHHGLWLNPEDKNHAILVNDGGLMFTYDDFETFVHPTNLPIGHQFSLAATQTEGKFWLYSNIQDSGAWRGEIDMTAGRDNITWTEWTSTVGDEAGRHAIDPTNPDIVYFTTRYGGGPFLKDFSIPDPEPVEGQRRRRSRGTTIAPDFGEVEKRAQWNAPIIISPHSTKRVLWGAQFVFLTDDAGANWKQISPDLTNYDPEKQGNIAFSTVWSIAESPLKKGLIYAGTDDGNFHTTMDEGETWTLNTTGLPEGRFISSIEASRTDEGTVYMTISGKRHNDYTSYVYKSTDYGTTWIDIGSDVPGECANVIRQDPENGNILYLGTDRSVYVSLDGGDSWQVLGSNLPTVYVHEIVIQTVEDVLAIATHGRSAWVIDIIPVREAATN